MVLCRRCFLKERGEKYVTWTNVKLRAIDSSNKLGLWLSAKSSNIPKLIIKPSPTSSLFSLLLKNSLLKKKKSISTEYLKY